MDKAKRKKNLIKWKAVPVLCAAAVLLAAKGYQVSGALASRETPSATAETGGDIDIPPSPDFGWPAETAAPLYDWSQPVPESEKADAGWFDDAIFIGNSRTEGFALYSGLDGIRAFTERGVTVCTVFTSPAVNVNGQKVSIMDAAEREDFSRCYIMLGMNELGWRSVDYFADKYGDIIDALRESHPDADIYVQSILPVTASRSADDAVYNNGNIEKFNSAIQDMCEEKQVYYLCVAEAVAGPDGTLPEDGAFDGIHLKAPLCALWLDYLETHTA